MVRDGDLLGDAINIASRLEALAQPSGICLSGAAHDFVRRVLPLSFDDLGSQKVKNIAEPISTFAVRLAQGGSVPARDPLPLPDKPSVAVLPLTTANADDEYLADGISEDIITALSKMRWLFVIARNSTFAYKGRAIEVTQIARQLGVVYIVTGSLRKSGSQVRISVQLAEGETGGSLWAERYDRELEDIFQLQDEVAGQVAGAIEPELLQKEGRRGADRPPQSLTAWDLVRRGMWEFHKFTHPTHLAALDLFRRAIEIAPHAADGHIWLSRTYTGVAVYGWADDPDAALRQAMAAGLRAVQLDDKNPYAHYAVAVSHIFAGLFDIAIRAAERTLSISPSFALGHIMSGVARLYAGQAQGAIEPLEHGLRLNPFDPQNFAWNLQLATAYYFAGQPGHGLDAAQRALDLRTHWSPALTIVALCALALRDQQTAQSALAEIRAFGDSGWDITRWLTKLKPQWAEHIDQVLGGLALS